jgi:hypothetical protein
MRSCPDRIQSSHAEGHIPNDDNGVTARGVGRLERQVLEAPLAGVVLRYGRLNGPGIIQGLTDGV